MLNNTICLYVLILCFLVLSIYSDWLVPSLKDKKERDKIVPHYDLALPTINSLQRFWNEFDPFIVSGMSQFLVNLPMDVTETPSEIDIHMDIPGVDKNDISITIHKHNELVISAHKQSYHKENGKNYKRMERFNGNVTRTLTLPEYADMDKMEAQYDNGVLFVKIPKIHKDLIEECPKVINIK